MSRRLCKMWDKYSLVRRIYLGGQATFFKGGLRGVGGQSPLSNLSILSRRSLRAAICTELALVALTAVRAEPNGGRCGRTAFCAELSLIWRTAFAFPPLCVCPFGFRYRHSHLHHQPGRRLGRTHDCALELNGAGLHFVLQTAETLAFLVCHVVKRRGLVIAHSLPPAP